MLFSTRPKTQNIHTLSQQLNLINDELTTTIDMEMQRLKEEEQELQNALKIKTRQDLIRTMEKELDMSKLNESSYSSQSANYANNPYFKTSSTYNLNQNNDFLTSQNLEEDLRKSHLILDNLMKDYINQTSIQKYKTDNLKELLKDTVNNSEFKNQYIDYDTQKLVRPNVIFSKSTKQLSRTNPESVKTIRIFTKTPVQDLNSQQTLRYSSKLDDLRSKSINDMYQYARTATNERDYARLIRDSHFYSDKEKINGIAKSKLRNSTKFKTNIIDNNSYTTLPLTKTLVHNKPWSYGKVECIYYPFRDNRIKKK